MKSATKHLLAMVLSKPAMAMHKPDPSFEHEAAESPETEKAEHETGIEAQDEDGDGPINAGAAYDLHSKLASHFSSQSHPISIGKEKAEPEKGLALHKLDTGLMDHKKAAAHLRHLANHFEKKGKVKGY